MFNQNAKTRKYCHIKSCSNAKGTTGQMFRLPKKQPLRQRWLDAISVHQPLTDLMRNYNLCELHFDADNLLRVGDGCKLKVNTVPSLFNSHKIEPQDVCEISFNEIKAEAMDLDAEEVSTVHSSQKDAEASLTKERLTPSNVHMMSQLCYICNVKSRVYSRNLYETRSKHTKTRISDFVLDWLTGHRQNRPDVTRDDNCVCANCLGKINRYDLMCVSVKRLETELRDTFLLTESLFKVVDEEKICTKSDEKPATILLLDPFTGKFAQYKETDGENRNEDNNSESDTETDSKIYYDYVCRVCGTVMNSPKMWKNHEHSFSNFELVVRKQSSRPQISDLNSDDDEKIIKRKYRNCTKCPARIAVDQYKEHTASHSIPCNPLKCIKCGFELKNEATFNEHMDFHDTSLPLECVICKQNGIRRMAIHKRNLRVHVRRHHDEQSVSCETCGIILKNAYRHELHVLYHHSNKPPVECDECGKTFSKKKSLAKHMAIHGAKRYACSICDKKFVYPANQRSHERTHDKSYSDKIHPCNFCNRTFARKNLVRKHEENDHEVLEFKSQ